VKAQEQITAEFNAFIRSPEVIVLLQQLSPTALSQDLLLRMGEFNALRENLEQLQQNAALFYPLILDDRLELVLTTPDSPPIRRTVKVTRAELNRAIVAFRQALLNPISDAKTPAEQLYKWLIQPLEADLKAAEVQTLIYAPDGQLRYIPLAALYDDQQWLVQRYRINNITAASLTDLNSQPQAQLQILAGAFASGHYTVNLGGQSFDLRGLPFAGLEVEKLAQTIPATTKLLDRAFNPEATVPKMEDYTVVHFATHAAFVVGTPEQSFILFGDGKWATLRDVQQWNLKNVDLVVLSACETGLGGKLGNGEEILGFGYLMQNAGARSSIASLWSVSDGGTQAFMDAFYAALKTGKFSKAEALRQAQIALITGKSQETGQQRSSIEMEAIAEGLPKSVANRLSHPYYWAPFILIGNGL
jgi:CHAT domain-containing protein